jgi:hypothetical protein
MVRVMRLVGLWLVLVGCYDLPKPACGFRCGTGATCPARYACAADGFCHAEGSPPAQTCPLVDAGADPIDFSPLVQSLAPPADAEDVSIDASISVKFTEQVLGISDSTFRLLDADAMAVAAHVTYDLPTRTATLDPDARLQPNRRYLARLGDGITGSRGEPLAGPRSWSFTTDRDREGPTLLSIDPPPGATNVSTDVTITLSLSEQVQFPPSGFQITANGGPTGTGTLSYPTPSTIVFRLVNCPPHALHVVTITNQVRDLAGNPFVNAPVTSTFTTGADTIAPTVVSVSPNDGDTDIGPLTKPSAFFSEPVTGISSASMTLEAGATSVPATVTYNPVMRRALLTPSTPLADGTVYTVRLTSGIQDASGNVLAPHVWSFTTLVPE